MSKEDQKPCLTCTYIDCRCRGVEGTPAEAKLDKLLTPDLLEKAANESAKYQREVMGEAETNKPEVRQQIIELARSELEAGMQSPHPRTLDNLDKLVPKRSTREALEEAVSEWLNDNFADIQPWEDDEDIEPELWDDLYRRFQEASK